MTLEGLRLAADLGGAWLAAPGGGLVLAERIQAHGLPQVLVLGRAAEDLAAPLAAAAGLAHRGVALNVAGLVPLGGDLAAALDLHRPRLGALVAALDAGLPWLDGRPMQPSRLPGRVFRREPAPLAPAHLGPLEAGALRSFLPDWAEDRLQATFRTPGWTPAPGGVEADLWPGVPVPPGSEMRVAPLELPAMTALSDGLRDALRRSLDLPIPRLPQPGDPGPLQALRRLTPDVAAFRGPVDAWARAFGALAQLPAPPHFCARC